MLIKETELMEVFFNF